MENLKEILFKRCNKCKKIKPKEDYTKRHYTNGKISLVNNCKECSREISKANHLVKKTKQKISEDNLLSNTKLCKYCNKVLDISNFRLSKNNKNIPNKQCNKCNELQKEHFFKYEYGISLKEKRLLIEKSNNKCNICQIVFKSESEAYLDHCHNSKKIRGILCLTCNAGIGYLKDNIELLKEAIKYLEIYKA